MQNDALSPPGERHDVYGYMWRPPPRLTPSESYWLHPVPFAVRLNVTAADPNAWAPLSVRFCGQTFASGAALRAARRAALRRNPRLKRWVGNWVCNQCLGYQKFPYVSTAHGFFAGVVHDIS